MLVKICNTYINLNNVNFNVDNEKKIVTIHVESNKDLILQNKLYEYFLGLLQNNLEGDKRKFFTKSGDMIIFDLDKYRIWRRDN